MTPSRALRAARPPTVASWIRRRIEEHAAAAATATLELAEVARRRRTLLGRIAEDPALDAVRVGVGAMLRLGRADDEIEGLALWSAAVAEAGR